MHEFDEPDVRITAIELESASIGQLFAGDAQIRPLGAVGSWA